MPNRLALETSPYLRQHQDNPVDWYPWGEEAFEKARAEDKAIFLSVGYSSCHWCHVMEHESFEDHDVAEILNRDFVSIKVDREERPDIDEAYMTAVQLSSGRGGWPMTVFLTPDQKPFFAGTYFPKEDRHGAAGFVTILSGIVQAWKTKREELQKAADQFGTALSEALTHQAPATFTQLDNKLLEQAVAVLARDFDQAHGGFGERPKFPPHTGIEFLMAYGLRESTDQKVRELAVAMSLLTLEKMCLGGIQDHVGGGFHRYSTDEKWLLPHFEKMLYDNALMLGNLAWAARIAMQLEPRLAALFIRAAENLVEWMQREMASPEGLFYSAIDADSEGEEGKFYVWTVDEVQGALGDRAAAFIAEYNLKPSGNFQDEATGAFTGSNVLHLAEDDEGAHGEDLERLALVREGRPRPALDDKVLIGWNGLAIAALAEAGAMPLAERAADAILAAEKRYGRLPHQIAGGKESGEAYLEDYAYFLLGLLKLAEYADPAHHGPGEDKGSPYFDDARRLGQVMVELFYDEAAASFFSTSSRHEDLFGRTRPVFDQPLPSATSVAVRCLLRLEQLEIAEKVLQGSVGWMERAPQASEGLLLAAMEMLDRRGWTDSGVHEVVAAAPAHLGQVQVSIGSRELPVGTDGWATTEVVLDIPAGMHVNTANPPARWLTPTRLEVEPVEHEVQYPEEKDYGYDGRLVIPIRLKLTPGRDAAEFQVKVTYQACTDAECLLPQERVFDGVLLKV